MAGRFSIAKKKTDGTGESEVIDIVDAAAEAPAATASVSDAPPLFYRTPTALTRERHSAAGVRASADYSFARGTNSLAINVFEFLEAAKSYPIVFTQGEVPSALAIVGLERENYFIDANGTWREGAYIPAYVRQYPFVLFEDQANTRLVLCVDEAAPHYQAVAGEGAERFYNHEGEPTEFTKRVMEFSSRYFEHHAITRNFAADLKKHDLLMPGNAELRLNSGRTLALAGFWVVDEAKFNALSDEVFLEFRRKGWLPLLYLALASASNWQRLAGMVQA